MGGGCGHGYLVIEPLPPNLVGGVFRDKYKQQMKGTACEGDTTHILTPEDQCFNRVEDQCFNRAEDQCFNRAEDRCFNRAEDQCFNRAEDQCFNRAEDQCFNRAEDQCFNRAEDQCFNRAVNQCFNQDEDQCFNKGCRTEASFFLILVQLPNGYFYEYLIWCSIKNLGVKRIPRTCMH